MWVFELCERHLVSMHFIDFANDESKFQWYMYIPTFIICQWMLQANLTQLIQMELFTDFKYLELHKPYIHMQRWWEHCTKFYQRETSLRVGGVYVKGG